MRVFISTTELELKEENVISIKRISKATTGGRSMRFNCVVAVGDGNGHVGIGFGKAIDVASAVAKAKEDAKKRIFKAPIINSTIPHELNIKYGSVRLVLKPASPGTGIIAGGPPRYVVSGILVVDTPSEMSVQRLIEHRGFTEEDARSRIKAQVAREKRLEIADFVIDNSVALNQLEPQIISAMKWATDLPETEPTPEPPEE